MEDKAFKSDMYHAWCMKEETLSSTSLLCAVCSKCPMGEQPFTCLGYFKVSSSDKQIVCQRFYHLPLTLRIQRKCYSDQ